MLKNKKLVIGLALVLIVSAVSGLTYAWFTASTDPVHADFDLGEVEIAGTFEVEGEEYLYEPGLHTTATGVVENIGNLIFVAKVTPNTISYLKYNEDLSVADPVRVIENDPNVILTIDPTCLGYKDVYDADDEYVGSVMWFYDANKADEYYVVMDPGTTADVDFKIAFDGEGMGNEYKNATVTLDNTWEATQALDGATQSFFDITYTDLKMVMKEIGDDSQFRTFSANTRAQELEAYAASVFGRE